MAESVFELCRGLVTVIDGVIEVCGDGETSLDVLERTDLRVQSVELRLREGNGFWGQVEKEGWDWHQAERG